MSKDKKPQIGLPANFLSDILGPMFAKMGEQVKESMKALPLTSVVTKLWAGDVDAAIEVINDMPDEDVIRYKNLTDALNRLMVDRHLNGAVLNIKNIQDIKEALGKDLD